MSNLRHTINSINPVKSFGRPARLFLLAVVVDGIIYSSWQLFYNFFILARGFDKDYLGLVNAAPSISAMIFGIPMGMLSDRIGRRRAMLLGILISTVAMGMQVLFHDPVLIFMMALLAGIGNMLYIVSQAPFMMSASTPENRALLFSLQFGVSTLSGSVGNLFAGQLPALFSNLLGAAPKSAASYQAVLLVSVVLGSLSLLPIFLIHEPKAQIEDQNAQPRRPIREIFMRPMVLKLFVPNAIIGLGAAILIPYMNVFFAERYRITDEALGVLFSLSSLLVGIGCVLGPRLASYLGSKVRAVVLTQSLSLGFLLTIGFSPFMGLAAVGFLMRAVLMNMAQPLFSAFAMEQIEPEDQGAVNSLLSLAWQIGWSVGPYLSGIVQERHGFTPLFIATAILYFVAITSTWVFFHKTEREKRVGVVGRVGLEVE